MKQFHQLCFITLSSLFVIMTIATSSSSAAAFTYLIPAQIPGAKHVTATNNHHRAAVTLSNENDEEQQAEAGDEVIYRPTISDDDAASLKSRSSNRSSSPNNNRRRYTTRQRTGDLPDVHWRSIPMSHLRCHPNFQPLPPPSQLSALPTKEHVRYFRQESWQWDYLHRGRCTTSQTAAALGFLESKAAVSYYYLWEELLCLSDDGGDWQTHSVTFQLLPMQNMEFNTNMVWCKIIANLPYSLSTFLLFILL